MAETKKYVRIIKNVSKYGDMTGQIFPSLGTWENAYKVDSPDRALYIRKEDVELIVTEKRKAAAGERVLLTAPTNTKGKYRVFDVFTVRESEEAGVRVAEDEFMTLWHKEYEVIVNSEIKNEEADEMRIDLNAMGYDELMAHGDAVMEAIKKRTFQEGFRAAKQVQRKLAKMNVEKSVQARRDEIVEQAKADIEVLKSPGRMVNGNTSDYKVDLFGANAEFIVNREKRTVVALLKGAYSGTVVLARGIAKAAPDECFNVHIGKAIALRRALGLTVPDEYLNAPQPTEVRVGDVVRSTVDKSKKYVIAKGEEAWSDGMAGLSSMVAKHGRIINDSREEVGE